MLFGCIVQGCVAILHAKVRKENMAREAQEVTWQVKEEVLDDECETELSWGVIEVCEYIILCVRIASSKNIIHTH